MKFITILFLIETSLTASENFKKDTPYLCLNTHTVQQCKTYNVKPEDAKKKPLEMSLKGDKLITKDNIEITFKMKRGDILYYSNQNLMLLLQGKI